jgi:hypothetical protein
MKRPLSVINLGLTLVVLALSASPVWRRVASISRGTTAGAPVRCRRVSPATRTPARGDDRVSGVTRSHR